MNLDLLDSQVSALPGEAAEKKYYSIEHIGNLRNSLGSVQQDKNTRSFGKTEQATPARIHWGPLRETEGQVGMSLSLEDSKALPNPFFQTPLDLSHYVVSPEGNCFALSKE